MPRLKQILASLLLIVCSASGQVLAESCTSVRKCNANCSIAFNSHWRYGSPGFVADMQVCEQHCMARNSNCTTEQSEETARDERSGPKDVDREPQERLLRRKEE